MVIYQNHLSVVNTQGVYHGARRGFLFGLSKVNNTSTN